MWTQATLTEKSRTDTGWHLAFEFSDGKNTNKGATAIEGPLSDDAIRAAAQTMLDQINRDEAGRDASTIKVGDVVAGA